MSYNSQVLNRTIFRCCLLFVHVQIFLDNLRSSLCCLSVVTASWLCNYVAVSDREMQQKAVQILHQLQTPSASASTSATSSESSLQYYAERSAVNSLPGGFGKYCDEHSSLSIGPFFVAYQNLPGRCLVCKHGSHVINIPKADWSSVKNKQLTATPC